jgi:hypothetical protein
MATDAGHVDVVRLLLNAGADPSIRSEYDDPERPETPLEVAERKGFTDIVLLLRAAKSPVKP